MAATMIPIQSITLTGSAASVTFSGIPQTYTDLLIRLSARGDVAGAGTVMRVVLNGTAANYSSTYLVGYGAGGTGSGRFSAATYLTMDYVSANDATANTFGSLEILLSQYAGSASKVLSGFGAGETNGTVSLMSVSAGLWSNSAAITSIQLLPNSGNLVAGSTFHLYGIKNT